MLRGHTHPLDLIEPDDDLELLAEELVPQIQTWSDCLGTVSSFSCSGTGLSAATLASIISCGS